MQQLQGWVALHHHSGLCSLKWQVNINFSPWPLPCHYDWFLHWSISMKLVSQLVGWSQGFGEFSCGFFCGLAGFCFVLIVCLFVFSWFSCFVDWFSEMGTAKKTQTFASKASEDFWLPWAGRVIEQRLNVRRQLWISDRILQPDTGQWRK